MIKKHKKQWRNALLLFVVVWVILYGILRVVFDVPHTADLFIRLSFGCFLIAMVYFYIATKEHEEY